MTSIRRRLTILLSISIGVLFLLTGIGVFFGMRELLHAQFDETLTAKARALITSSEVDDDEFEIDLIVQDFAGFGLGGTDFFEIRRQSGDLLLRSPSLTGAALEGTILSGIPPPLDDTARIMDGRFSDGSRARFYVSKLYPKDDEDAEYRDLYLTVASPTRVMDRELTMLAIVLAIAGGTALLLMGPLTQLGLRRGLRPLKQLADELSRIRPENLDQRLQEDHLPSELIPVAVRLNQWLSRLEESFNRERRFSSHAAHELRTPLAELRSIAELGTLWPEEANPSRSGEIVKVADELVSLLDKLTLLAHSEAGHHIVKREPVNLGEQLSHALARVEATAQDRELNLATTLIEGEFFSDPVLWNAVLQNLLSNAVSYAPRGASITIEVSPRHLSVSNPAPDLDAGDIPHLFERFWRKNQSHLGEGHSGLGMSIIRSCTLLLSGECVASLSPEGLFAVRVMWEPSLD